MSYHLSHHHTTSRRPDPPTGTQKKGPQGRGEGRDRPGRGHDCDRARLTPQRTIRRREGFFREKACINCSVVQRICMG